MIEAFDNVGALEKSLERQLAWIRQSDTKAQMLIAVNLALIGAVVGKAPSADGFDWRVWIVFLVGTGWPMLNLYWCFASVSPHVKDTPNSSLLFFGLIESLGEAKYTEAIGSRTQEDYEEDLIRQTFINAKIANTKYRRLTRVTNFMFACVPLSLVAIGAFYFKWYEILPKVIVWHR